MQTVYLHLKFVFATKVRNGEAMRDDRGGMWLSFSHVRYAVLFHPNLNIKQILKYQDKEKQLLRWGWNQTKREKQKRREIW
jgi:hypothetical protein